jgi:hypothetical protein
MTVKNLQVCALILSTIYLRTMLINCSPTHHIPSRRHAPIYPRVAYTHACKGSVI